MDFALINMGLICICAFGAVLLITVIIIRTNRLRGDAQKINKRLEFWLSEKAVIEHSIYGDSGEKLTREKTFTERVLLPLGEQVGSWMAEKVPYTSQQSKKLALIKAGIRTKNAIFVFYSSKLAAAALIAIGCFILMVTVDMKKAIGLSIMGGALGYILPNLFVENLAKKKQKNIDRVLPDALDLLVICTEAGMGIDQSLLRVAANLGTGGKELQEEIVLTNREMNLGQDRFICWKNFGERTISEELKNLATVIIQCEKVGSQIAQVLRDQSEFLRVRRRQKAEEVAAQMTIKMMIPMVLFIFPCILAVTVGPPVLKIIAAFTSL